ncbi:hypothetical protein [Shewanella psychrotolerans]|uniref:hypothetical protein n=1 Tax=Shewanella psychrotolerans TaxID=2864206 RepID=UPI001C65BFA5|nr:hypothetical protein [Shewanella psychrotolerans]QYK01687.1 hypothetical protein K0I62_01485 [Shewanella psychrotolerans]
MRRTLRHHTLVVFTLLAMLGQVTLSNGFSMVSYAQADEMPMMQMSNGDDCHESQVDMKSQCCDGEQNVLPAAQHCCEGNGYCKGDCNHCLVISVVGTLFTVKSWPGFSSSESIMAIQMPHFHSISLGSAFRPPIA